MVEVDWRGNFHSLKFLLGKKGFEGGGGKKML